MLQLNIPNFQNKTFQLQFLPAQIPSKDYFREVVHPRPFPLMGGFWAYDTHLGWVGFTGCTAWALHINFVNFPFPFKRKVDFGSCRHDVCLSQAPHGQELDIRLGPFGLPAPQICMWSFALSPPAMLRWKGYTIPQHCLQESRVDGEVSSCQGNTWYLSKLPTEGLRGSDVSKWLSVFSCACNSFLLTLSTYTSPL